MNEVIRKSSNMAREVDFKEWLENQYGIDGAEDLLQIYRPIANQEDGWMYSMVPEGDGYVVRGGEKELYLTQRSRDAFVKYMDSLHELGVEGQAAFDKAMRRED